MTIWYSSVFTSVFIFSKFRFKAFKALIYLTWLCHYWCLKLIAFQLQYQSFCALLVYLFTLLVYLFKTNLIFSATPLDQLHLTHSAHDDLMAKSLTPLQRSYDDPRSASLMSSDQSDELCLPLPRISAAVCLQSGTAGARDVLCGKMSRPLLRCSAEFAKVTSWNPSTCQ